MKELILNFFDLGFGAFFSCMTACIIITAAAMWLLRKLPAGKFKTGWRYALWIILPLCFLVPIKFKAPYTVIPLPPSDAVLYIESPEQELSGIADVNRYAMGWETVDGILLSDILIWVWLAGAAGTLAYQLIKLAALKKRIKRRGVTCANGAYKNTLGEICGEMKIRVPEIIVFPETDTPFAMGILRPKIIIPAQDVSVEEIGFIFRHEAVHIKRGDILIKLLMIIFRSINWFNPFAYIMCRQAFEDMEIACDERTVNGFSEDKREIYSKTILKGISKNKYPAVTTYLSSNALTVKKRICAVMTPKKLGWAIPFVLVLPLMLLLTGTVYVSSDYFNMFAAYIEPYPMEADPYVTAEEWKTCTASNAEEAGRKIFTQYMDMYTGEDVPEYYRINGYSINEISSYGENKIKEFFSDGIVYPLFDRSSYVNISYNVEFANDCGNYVHNKNIGFSFVADGCVEKSGISLELERKGNTYTLKKMGIFCGLLSTGTFHFDNQLEDTLMRLDFMAKSGLLDENFNSTDNFPDPAGLCAYSYLIGKRFPGYHGNDVMPIIVSQYGLPFNMRLNTDNFEDYITGSGCIKMDAEKFGEVDEDKLTFTDAGFEYSGYDFDVKSGNITLYGNVTGNDPHGVKLRFEHTLDDYSNNLSFNPRLVWVQTADTLYPPAEYNDSFEKVLTAEMKGSVSAASAESALEYMKTPRDGSDFTVLDYRNISAEADGVYAEVKFKGRLEGVYSFNLQNKLDEITHEPLSDGYIRVKVL